MLLDIYMQDDAPYRFMPVGADEHPRLPKNLASSAIAGGCARISMGGTQLCIDNQEVPCVISSVAFRSEL
jgi:hypothetical protein